MLKKLCCDSPKVKALISHLLFKYLISEQSVSAPTSFRWRESDGFSGEDEVYRGTSQTVDSSGIEQDGISFMFICYCFVLLPLRLLHSFPFC